MKTTLLLAAALFTTTLFAQDFTVPKNLTLETEADYVAQNENIVAAVNWLRDTHINNEPKKRKRINAYLLQWLTGTPTMTLTLNADLVDYGECADCLMLYMGGYAKTVIESGNKEVKSIEKFIKLRGKGKLETAIAKML